MQVITNVLDLSRGYVFVDGFVFKALTEPANNYDAIVIRNPGCADCWTPKVGKSMRSLDEHIEYINQNRIDKAVIIAESIDFVSNCPSLEFIEVIPSDTINMPLDYSPLYSMPQLRWLRCSNSQGQVDFRKLTNIESLYLESPEISGGLEAMKKLKTLNVSEYKGDFSNLIFSRALEELDIINCNVKSLCGISFAESLSILNLSYNRQLCDISELAQVSRTLKSLSIAACPKISDFSVLNELTELEHLELLGNNSVSNLGFLSRMSKLKTLSFSVNILDGDLSPCLQLPYACCLKGRKHYNLKDKDLPHNYG